MTILCGTRALQAFITALILVCNNCQAQWTCLSSGTCVRKAGNEEVNYDTAVKKCAAIDGIVPESRSSKENDELVKFAKGFDRIWIGISDSAVEGQWRYASDDNEIRYNNWDLTPVSGKRVQPDNGQNDKDDPVPENCAVLQVDKNNWHDFQCRRKFHFVCAKKPEPTTTTTSRPRTTTTTDGPNNTTTAIIVVAVVVAVLLATGCLIYTKMSRDAETRRRDARAAAESGMTGMSIGGSSSSSRRSSSSSRMSRFSSSSSRGSSARGSFRGSSRGSSRLSRGGSSSRRSRLSSSSIGSRGSRTSLGSSGFQQSQI